MRLVAPRGVEIEQEQTRTGHEANRLLDPQLGVEQVDEPATQCLRLTGDRLVQTGRQDVGTAP